LAKPDYPGARQAENEVTCKGGGWKERGETMIAFHQRTGFRMLAAGEGSWDVSVL